VREPVDLGVAGPASTEQLAALEAAGAARCRLALPPWPLLLPVLLRSLVRSPWFAVRRREGSSSFPGAPVWNAL
jgi:hypothetical protein